MSQIHGDKPDKETARRVSTCYKYSLGSGAKEQVILVGKRRERREAAAKARYEQQPCRRAQIHTPVYKAIEQPDYKAAQHIDYKRAQREHSAVSLAHKMRQTISTHTAQRATQSHIN